MKYAVKYFSRYLGFGINEYEREYFEDEASAIQRAEQMKKDGYYDVSVIRVSC